MDPGILGKTPLVMAAGGELGSATFTALASEGAIVAISDQNHLALDKPYIAFRLLAVKESLSQRILET